VSRGFGTYPELAQWLKDRSLVADDLGALALVNDVRGGLEIIRWVWYSWATGILLRARPVIGHLSPQMVGDVDDLDHIWHGPAHHPLEPLSQGQLRGGTALTPSGHLNVEVSVRDFHKHNLAAVRVDSGIDFPVQEILDECSDLGVPTLTGVDALWAREDGGYATSQLLT